MADRIWDRMRKGWNAFLSREEEILEYRNPQQVYYSSSNPSRSHISTGGDKSIVSAVYNRIGLDVSTYDVAHVRINDEGQYVETIQSGLQNCLTIEANKDQSARAFFLDCVISMFLEGHVAVVPVDTKISPLKSGSFEIQTMRTGKVINWYPDYVKIDIYNDRVGKRERIVVPKSMVAIVENPLYTVMNEPNGTMKRLVRKLNILDAIDEQSGSGKLDLIIQLPYVVKTQAKEQQAESRRQSIEKQLTGSKYGIAYTDATEHITQLNRPAENNLLNQITYLTDMLYNQLGVSAAVFNGTANDAEMLNYYERTIEPIIAAFTEEFKRKFLTKTARAQGQTIMGFRDVFKFVPASQMAKMADSFTRNEIMTSNEIRSVIGMKPSKAPQADELRNKNMPAPDTETPKEVPKDEEDSTEESNN